MKKKPFIVVHHTKCPTDNKIENLCWVDMNKRITVKDKPKNKTK